MNKIIAHALRNFISSLIEGQEESQSRLFFRTDGFDDVYPELLDLLSSDGLNLGGHPLVVRTTGEISGYERFALEQGKTATWYRNHLEPGQVLLLLNNKPTSDAQSLKDIFPINETLLVGEKGIDTLIKAAFQNGYQLTAPDHRVLCGFLAAYEKTVHVPQVRDLAQFLSQVNQSLMRGERIEKAIAECLPYLGLFRCRDLAETLGDKGRTEQLLRDLDRAARLGSELLSESDQRKFLQRLKPEEFDDESPFGGLNPQEKYQTLRRFLTEVITDKKTRLSVLHLDWREVNQVLFKPPRKTTAERLGELARSIEQQVSQEELPAYAQDVVRDLAGGQMPDADDLDRLTTEERDRLGKQLTRKLRQLVKTRSYPHSDFLAGLVIGATELLTDNRDASPAGLQLKVTFIAPETVTDDHAEALQAFRALYGGVESVMTALKWDIGNLSSIIEAHNNSDETSEPATKHQSTNLNFRLTLNSGDEVEIARAELVWQYLSDSPAATTLRALLKLEEQNQPEGPFIPIFHSRLVGDEINDLDLHRPLRTIGAWFDSPGNLRQHVRESLDRPAVSETARLRVDESLANLETTWGRFVSISLTSGFLSGSVPELLNFYERMLETAATQLQGGQEIHFGFRALSRAWVIGPEVLEDWAIVPLLHPFKLLWWQNRARHFNSLLSRLLDVGDQIDLVDVVRFRRGLNQTYSSSSFPAALVLPNRTGQPATFLPLNEVEGYELFRPEDMAGAAQGLDADLVSEQEADEESAKAAEYLAGVVTDYINTFPFVRDGVEIYLVGCRNGALPGQLVERVNRREFRRSSDKPIRISVIVHTTDRGAPLFGRVTSWLHAHEEFLERVENDYFPRVSLRVLECSYEKLYELLGTPGAAAETLSHDIVILPDILSERGQKVQTRLIEPPGKAVARDDYLPFLPLLRSQPMPFERGEMSRITVLTPQQQPEMAQRFYNAQWAFRERSPIKPGRATEFDLSYSLDEWSDLLKKLHKTFNWAVCYDTTIDRFLLEDTFPNDVEVIRYSTGLGTKGNHNLTVSSSYWARRVVVRRLTMRLRTLFPAAPEEFCGKIAERLVDEAKQISGDIVLRAAGPGKYLNELIGLVLSKYLTEQRYKETHSGALIAWIYLDDFEHWFDGKYPDLLFVAIPTEANGELPLHMEILESKCVSDSIFINEAADAEHQVQRGVNRLSPAWSPNRQYLDADYWYDQLYRAMVSNLMIDHSQVRLWDALRNRLPEGNYTLDSSGHVWAFCYDGPATTEEGRLSDEGRSSMIAENAPEVPLYRHYFGRRGLVEVLKSLVEAWSLQASPDIWQIETAPPQIQEPLQVTVTAEEQSSEPEIASELPAQEIVVSADPDSLRIAEQSLSLDRVLRQYGISAFPVDPANVDVGPSVLRYKVRLRPPEKDRRLQSLANDLARELALHDVPLIERLPGTQYIAIDIPRQERVVVPLVPTLSELNKPSLGSLPFLVGMTPDGRTVVRDLAQLPHLLVAGTTGAGKTVFLYSILISLMYQFAPHQLSVLLVDPKQTDFVFFRGLPYLRTGHVVTDPAEALEQLRLLTDEELETRTALFSEARVTKISEYNDRMASKTLAPIVVVVDEYADLVDVMTKHERGAFERAFRRLAQRARSVGIHLVIATQRPSADIVTTSLKTNLSARVAFRLPAHHDSMTVLDQSGAENLLGRGDMLFSADGRVERLQGFHIGTTELEIFVEQKRE